MHTRLFPCVAISISSLATQHQHLVEELVRLAPVVGHPTLCGSGSAASERVECKGRSRRQPSTFSHQLQPHRRQGAGGGLQDNKPPVRLNR
jgi:hypothetical protein